MNDYLLGKYNAVREEMERLEEQKKEIEEQLFDAFDEVGNNYAEMNGYYIARRSRRSFDYSDKVKELGKQVTAQKKLEEEDGTATLKKESQYIRWGKVEEDAHDKS